MKRWEWKNWRSHNKTDSFCQYQNYLNWGFLFAHLNHDSKQWFKLFQFSQIYSRLNCTKQAKWPDEITQPSLVEPGKNKIRINQFKSQFSVWKRTHRPCVGWLRQPILFWTSERYHAWKTEGIYENILAMLCPPETNTSHPPTKMTDILCRLPNSIKPFPLKAVICS